MGLCRSLALLVMAAVLAVTSACGGGRLSEDEDGLTVEQILAGIESSADDVKTCRYELTMKVFAFSQEIGMQGDMDLQDRKAKFRTQMSVSDDWIEAEYYALGDEMYMRVNAEGQSQWVKARMPEGEGYWDTANPVDEQRSLLEQALNWDKVGTEKVEGIDCYVLDVLPNLQKLWAALGQEGGIDEDQLGELIMRYWVAKDTFYIVKMHMTMVVADADMFEWEIVLYDYNKPVDIELPPEAENATEVDPDQI